MTFLKWRNRKHRRRQRCNKNGISQSCLNRIICLQVIQEIDDMMQDTPSSEGDIIEYNEALEKGKEVLSAPLYEDSEYIFLTK